MQEQTQRYALCGMGCLVLSVAIHAFWDWQGCSPSLFRKEEQGEKGGAKSQSADGELHLEAGRVWWNGAG